MPHSWRILLPLVLVACDPLIPAIMPPNDNDRTPPTVTFTMPVESTFVVGDMITFAGEVSDDDSVASVEVRVNATGAFQPVDFFSSTIWSVAVDTTGLSAADYTVTVRATDDVGNSGTATKTITLTAPASTAPVATLSNTPATLTNATDIAVTVGGTGVTHYRYSLDGGTSSAVTPVATVITASGLTDGMHTLSVFGSDDQGHEQASATTFSWTVDTTGPTITLAGAPSGRTASSSFTIDVNSPQPDAFTYDWGITASLFATGATGVAFSTDITLSNYSEDTFTLAIMGTDALGNTGPTVSRTFTIDQTGPVALLTSAPAPNVRNAQNTWSAITVSSPDSDAFTYSYGLSGPTGRNGSAILLATPFALTNLPDGDYTLTTTVFDDVGNAGTPDVLSFTVDATGPDLSLASAPTGRSTIADFFITVSSLAADGFSYAWTLTGPSGASASNQDFADPIVLSSLLDGSYTLTVTGKDDLGNSGTPSVVTFVVDTVGPSVTLSGPAPNSRSATKTFAIDVNSPDSDAADYRYGLTGPQSQSAATQLFSADISFSNLPDGTYTLTTIGTDDLSNDGPADVRSFTVDTTGPTITVVGAPSDGSTVSQTSFSIQVQTLDAFPQGYSYALTGPTASSANNRNFSQLISLSSLADGDYVLTVNGSDDLNNVGTDVVIHFKVDTSGVSVTLSGAPANNARTRTRSYTIDVNSSDVDAFNYDWSLTGPAPTGATGAAFSTDITLSNLSDGAYTLTVTGRDATSNSGVPTVVSFTVDTIGPSLTLTGAPTDASRGATNVFDINVDSAASDALSYRYALGLSGATGASGIAFSSNIHLTLADGNYSLIVVGTDDVGNDGAADSRTFTVDATGPTVALVGAPSDNGYSRQSAFTIDVTSPAIDAQNFDYTLSGPVAASGTHLDIALQDIVLSGLADGGPYTLTVRGYDDLGNAGTALVTNFNIDSVGPTGVVLTRDTPATSPSQNTSLHATITTTDSNTTGYFYDYTLSCGASGPTGVSGVAYGDPISASNLPEGSCTLNVSLNDAVGNAVPAQSTWLIDRTAPAGVQIVRAPSGSITSSTSVTADVTTSDASTTGYLYTYAIACTGPSGVFGATGSTNYGTPFTYSSLPEGNCTIDAAVIDLAGNGASASQSAWTIDTTAPVVAVSGVTNGTTIASLGVLDVNSAASDAANYDWQLEGPGGYLDFEGPFSFSQDIPAQPALADGDYVLTIYGKDNVGNQSTIVFHFTIDASPPVITCPPPFVLASDAIQLSFDQPVGQLNLTTALNADSHPSGALLELTPSGGVWTPIAANQKIQIEAFTNVSGSVTSAMKTCTVDIMPATSAILYVDSSAPGGGDGSRANPFQNLSDAFAVSGPAAVLVRQGTYTFSNDTDSLVSDVSIYGGYDPSDWNKRDPDAHVSRVEKVGGTAPADVTNPRPVLVCGAASANTVIDGLTFAGASGVDASEWRSGITLSGPCDALFRHNVFSQGSAQSFMGVLATPSGESHAVFEDNAFNDDGGSPSNTSGIRIGSNAGITVHANTFDFDYAGGVSMEGVSVNTPAYAVSITDNTFNLSNNGNGPTAVVLSTNTTFDRNTVTISGVSGGAHAVFGNGAASVSHSTITLSGDGDLWALQQLTAATHNTITVQHSATGTCKGILQVANVIDDNTIIVGDCFQSTGIDVGNVALDSVSRNTVTADDAALYLSSLLDSPGPSGIVIADNRVEATRTNSMTMTIDVAGATTGAVYVRDNIVSGEWSGMKFSSLVPDGGACAVHTIERNRVSASTADALTIRSDHCVAVKNNILVAVGNAIDIDALSGPTGLTQNTEIVNNSLLYHKTGVLNGANSSPVIINNIFSGDDGTGVGFDVSQSTAMQVYNNDFFFLSSAVYGMGGCGPLTPCDVGALNALAGGGALVGGNVNVDPKFTSPYGAPPGWEGNDFHLDIVPENCDVRVGGLSPVLSGVSDAIDDIGLPPASRTTGLPAATGACSPSNGATANISMGAYEIDD